MSYKDFIFEKSKEDPEYKKFIEHKKIEASKKNKKKEN